MSLETLSNVKLCLCVSGTTDDSLLTQLQQSADSFIEDYCGRNFRSGTITEYHAGGAQVLFLKNFPLLAVTSLSVDVAGVFEEDSLRPAYTYRLHLGRGVIENIDGSFVPSLPGWRTTEDHFPGAVRVIYTTDSAAVPNAVKRASVELIGHWYKQAKTMANTQYLNVTQTASGGTETTYAWGQSTGFKLPEGVLQLLRPFRNPAM